MVEKKRVDVDSVDNVDELIEKKLVLKISFDLTGL